jgi:hypothetical protein
MANKIKVAIIIKGGIVQSVYSTKEIDVDIIDFDDADSAEEYNNCSDKLDEIEKTQKFIY